jgi:hypothetical protein
VFGVEGVVRGGREGDKVCIVCARAHTHTHKHISSFEIIKFCKQPSFWKKCIYLCSSFPPVFTGYI